MASGGTKRPRRDGRDQLTFDGYFELPRRPEATPGSFGFSLELRNLLAQALKECPLSRAEVAGRMTALMYGDAGDGEITLAMINSWTRSADAWRFPLEALPAFVEATGAVWLLDRIAERCGCKILVGEQALLAQLGAIALKKRRLSELEAEIKRTVPHDIVDRVLNREGRP